MSISRREALFLGAAVPPSFALLWGTAHAQPAGQAPTGLGAVKDPLMSACLLIGGRKQIENCTFALKKLQTEDAKAFAQAEIDEHVAVKKRLKELGFDYPVAPQPRGAVGTTPTGPGTGTSGVRPVGGTDTQPGSDGTTDEVLPAAWVVTVGKVQLPIEAACLVAVEHEVAENCIRNYRKEMEQYAGLKLDKRFLGHQLDEHLALLDKAQAFRRHSTANLDPVIADVQKTIEKHIAHCKALMEKLDGMREKGGD